MIHFDRKIKLNQLIFRKITQGRPTQNFLRISVKLFSQKNDLFTLDFSVTFSQNFTRDESVSAYDSPNFHSKFVHRKMFTVWTTLT
jgi:hypothetical protein